MARPSHVRDAVRDLIAGSDRHDWSVDEVLAALAEQAVPADFSSVCRGLTHLERAGDIRRVNLGDGKMRYEARGEHHDHVRCESCGSVAGVQGCLLDASHGDVEAATGYVIRDHALLFSGLCRTCAQEPPCSGQ